MRTQRETACYATAAVESGKGKTQALSLNLNEWLRLIAGAFVLLALVLGATVHPYWNYFAAFVAVNLLQSAFTGWCPMMAFLRKLGVEE
ncbi:MAG: DUF2892 domain-containing protein [Nitrospirota bacterium]